MDADGGYIGTDADGSASAGLRGYTPASVRTRGRGRGNESLRGRMKKNKNERENAKKI
jgi:hypothetical protein